MIKRPLDKIEMEEERALDLIAFLDKIEMKMDDVPSLNILLSDRTSLSSILTIENRETKGKSSVGISRLTETPNLGLVNASQGQEKLASAHNKWGLCMAKSLRDCPIRQLTIIKVEQVVL